jgi:hypothetical protein
MFAKMLYGIYNELSENAIDIALATEVHSTYTVTQKS